ncbi:S8 family serine peptidase [Rudanella lutea]|uniref:S8 family serine peptidase n=1 Tax=Rudanella lutea TaxID=451374 RepID=UPI00037F3554|nr:S8 family serine peptidase [Rudanella lutea]
MTYRYFWIATTALLAVVIWPSWAQPLPQYTASQLRQQTATQQAVREFRQTNFDQAVEKARLLDRPVRVTQPDGTVQQLWGLDERGNLLYEHTYNNIRAASTTRTSDLYTGGGLGLSLSGSSPNVRDRLAIWDGGRVRGSHLEFGSRVTQMDNPAGTDNHATHVAGTLVAQGRNPLVRGMAFGANLKAYDFASGDTEIAEAAGTYLVSNHSYGFTGGWFFNSSRSGSIKWEWYGDTTISEREDYKFGFYDSNTRNWDRIAFNAPYYLLVKSAGNSHGSNGPGDGQPYVLINHRNATSTKPRSDQNGYDQISTNSTAKNILTVAAVSNILGDYNLPSDVQIASFSSWGPTDDGRIKPDIAAVGVDILSNSSRNDSAYAVLSGTSMSAPNATGSLLLLQELYASRNKGDFMRASTLKGLVLHTASEAGDAPGPDYRFGWGLLNTARAAQVLLNTDQNHLLSEQSLLPNQTYSLPVVASGRGPLTVTIVWHDPEATATTLTAANVNSRTPKLVNDLDLRITTADGRQTSLPWVLNPDSPAQAATTGDNIRDNVEQVVVQNTVPGQSYTITVTHKSSLINGKQDYALLASGVGGTAYCASGSTNDGLQIKGIQLGSLSRTASGSCVSYSDFTQTSLPVQVGQTLPFSVTAGTCNGAVARGASVRVFADWNNNGLFTDPGDTLTTSDIFSNTGTFATTLQIPPSVSLDQLVRVRVVVSETGFPNFIAPCGSYSRGETQDYLLRIIRSLNDVGVAGIITPDASYCPSNSTPSVTVRVRNFGSQTQRNVPVDVTVTDPATGSSIRAQATLPVLSGFRESLLSVPFRSFPGTGNSASYRITATTSLTVDQNPMNNLVTETRTVTTGAPLSVSAFTASVCGTDTTVALRNNSVGTAFWYSAPTGGNLLAVNNIAQTRQRQNVYYVDVNSLNALLGPVAKTAFNGGSYSGNFGPAPLISTRVPVLLESARIYTAAPGRLTFTVRRLSDDVAVSTVSLDVTATRNSSLTALNASGQLVDDPNDPGAEYPLNLRIPQAGDYRITIGYEGGVSIFRSNVGVAGFPYQIRTASGEPIVSIRGSLFDNASTGQTDTLTNAWYYLYNLRVRSLDCPAPARVAVSTSTGQLPVVNLTADGSTTICRGAGVTLQATATDMLTYQWLFNGQPINGATSATFRATGEGAYSVRVANNCVPTSSSSIQVSLRESQAPTVQLDGLVLRSDATISNQWLLNGIPITGATSQSLTATQTGRYAVRGNVNGCGEVVSNEVLVTILATDDPLATGIEAFPNPTTQRVTVRLPLQPRQQLPTARLVTATGQTVTEKVMQREANFFAADLDLSNQAGGTFFVVILGSDGGKTAVVRITKL